MEQRLAEQFTAQTIFAQCDNLCNNTTYNGRVGLHAIHRALEACYQSMMHSRNAISLSCNRLYTNLFI